MVSQSIIAPPGVPAAANGKLPPPLPLNFRYRVAINLALSQKKSRKLGGNLTQNSDFTLRFCLAASLASCTFVPQIANYSRPSLTPYLEPSKRALNGTTLVFDQMKREINLTSDNPGDLEAWQQQRCKASLSSFIPVTCSQQLATHRSSFFAGCMR